MPETIRQTDPQLIKSLVDGSMPIEAIDQRLQAYTDLDPDTLVPIQIQRLSDHPIRILMFPTSREFNTPIKIAAAKIGTEALYWHAVGQSLVYPNKLRAHEYGSLELLPVITNNNQPHLVYADWPDTIERLQEEHPHRLYNYYVRTINYGGDGDFFSDLNLGRVEQDYLREKGEKVSVRLNKLGIKQSSADASVNARNAVYTTSHSFFEKTTLHLINSEAFPQHISQILKRSNQHFIHSGNIAIALINKVSNEDIYSTIITICNYLKQNHFLVMKSESHLYQAITQLAHYLEEMYFTATGERIFQKYPISV